MSYKLFEALNSMNRIILSINQHSEVLFNLIKEYSVVQNKEVHLKKIMDELEEVDKELQNAGYTYTPPSDEDYDEEDFEDVLEMFGDFLKNYMTDFDINDVEIYNTEIKQMVSVIDRHMNGFVNENAVILEDE